MLRLRRWLFRNPVTPTRTKPIRTTRLGMEQLEAREVPAQFTVSLLNPGTGRAGSAGASFSGPGLSLNNPSVEADNAADAVRLALAGSVDVSYQGRTANYAFSTTTAGTDAAARNFAYLVTQPAAAVDPAAWRIGLEDLSASNMQSLGVDWDYNDRYWDVTVTEVATPVLGDGTGLLARYFNGSEAPNLAAFRVDPQVNNDWGSGSPDPAVTADRFTATWNGEVLAAYTQTYKFTTVSDDGVRLWVNGQLVVDNWTNHSATRNSGSIALEAGRKYDIRMEYYENTGLAAAKLLWSGRYQAEEAVPQAYLYPDVAPTPVPGEGTGLLARYVSTSDAPNLAAIRVDPQVNNDWGTGSPDPAVGTDRFRATWTGQVQAPFDGPFTFSTLSDDGVRLWVDGNLVIDNWTDHGPTRNNSATVTLAAGEKYDLRMEYYENGGGAVAKLFWASPDLVREVIPTQYLYPAEPPTPVSGSGTGLDATYFADRTLTAAVLNRVDPLVNNAWSADSPAAGVPADNFSVRWSGYVQAPLSGPFTFSTVSDDGVRLWVDGNLVIDNWTDHSTTRNKSGTIELEAGAFYRVVMEYYERSGQAVAQLEWASPDLVREPIPQQYLYPVSSVSTVSVTASTDAAEGGDPGTFMLTRTGGDPSQPLTAWFTLGGTATKAADYTVSGATYDAGRQQYKITFPADGSGSGSGSSEVVVTISAVDDTVYDPGEVVALTVVSGPASYAVAPSDSASIAIVDNEPDAVVWVEAAAVDGVVGVAEGTYTTLKLRREQGDVAQPLSVLLAILPDAEGNKAVEWGVNATLTGPAGEDLSTGGLVAFPSGSDELLLTLRTWASELDGTPEDQRAGFRLAVIPGSSRYDAGDSTRSDRPAGVDVQIDARPYPIKQAVTTAEGTSVSFVLGSVVADGLTVSYSAFSQPLYGTLSISGNVATYTPVADFAGYDFFLFQASTSLSGVTLASNLGVVRVHVEAAPTDPVVFDPFPPPNDPPEVGIVNSLWVVHEGGPVDLAAVAVDPNGSADIVRVRWDFDYSGLEFVADPSAASLTPTTAFSTPGIYYIAVEVTDSAGQVATDVSTVLVLTADDPSPDSVEPAAFLPTLPSGQTDPVDPPSPDPSVPSGWAVITPSASSAPVGGWLAFTATGGSDLSVEWDFDYDGTHFAPTGFGTSISHTFVGPGTYTVAADVYDFVTGESEIVTRTVTVADVPRLVVLPPDDRYGEEGTPIAFAPPDAWLDLTGSPDAPASASLGSIEWDFDFFGTFVGDPQATGNPTPTHQYQPGRHVAAIRLTDSLGNTGFAVFNVDVATLPPEVDAGPDRSVDAGTVVTLIGSAFDASGIVSVDWDFDYDGETFDADPVAAGNAMPTHTFTDVGTFWVAYRARANDGTESIDFAEITVNNTAPTGTVSLAATRPDGSPQSLAEGSEIFFAVAGLGDTDPDFPPLVWADWGDDGSFDLVDIDPATGLISHTYDDNGTYNATFRVADLQGLYAESRVAVAVANVGPSASLVIAADKRNGRYEFDPGTPVTLRFTDVIDPSWEDTFAEYTYHYRVNGGEWYSAGASEFVPVELYPGGSYTVEAYVADKDGGQSEYLTQEFLVLSDRVVRNSGTGRVELSWTNPGGTAGTTVVAANGSFRFEQQVTSIFAKLLDAGAIYDLSTNFGFDAVNGNNLNGVNLTVATDRTDGLPAFVGSGNVGVVTVGDSGRVKVTARGDFGGLLGNPDSFAELLAFRNQTGRILADRAGQIIASGTITQIDLNAGATLISANKYDPNGSIHTHNQPGRPVPTLVFKTGPGGYYGSPRDTGGQRVEIYDVDSNGRTLRYERGPASENGIITYSYTPDGRPATITDAFGTWTLTQAADKVVVTPPPGNPDAVGRYPGQPIVPPPPPAPVQPISDTAPAWYETVWAVGYDAFTVVSTEIETTVTANYNDFQRGLEVLHAVAEREWNNGQDAIKWAITTTGEGVLRVGDYVATATEAAAERFVQNVAAFGGPIADLLTLAGKFGTAANDVFQAIVNSPLTFIEALAGGVRDGFDSFATTLPQNLPSKLFEWLTAGISLPDAPASLDAKDLAPWLLKFFGLDREGIQGILVNAVGPGNVAVLTEAYELLDAALSGADGKGVFDGVNAILAKLPDPEKLDPQVLATEAVNAIVTLVVQEIAKKAPVVILSKLNPGGAVLTTVYNGLTWLVGNIDKLSKQADTLVSMIDNVRSIAKTVVLSDDLAYRDPATNKTKEELITDAKAGLQQKVATVLNNGIPLAISFAAQQLNIGKLPELVAGKIASLQNAPRKKVEDAVNAIVAKVSNAAGSNANKGAFEGSVGPKVEFEINGEKHTLWVKNDNGDAVVMLASTPIPRLTAKDLIKKLPAWELATEAQLERMQTFITELTTLGKQAIAAEKQLAAFQTQLEKYQKDNKTRKLNGQDPRPGLFTQLKGYNSSIFKAENSLILEIKTALKVKYSLADEPDLPANFNDDGALLKYPSDAIGVVNPLVNGKYTKPPQFSSGVWPAGLAKGRTVHAHHIVIKEGGANTADAAYVARQILWLNNINPYTANENLVWAPLWNHNKQYANDVLKELLVVRDKGAAELASVLKNIAKRFIAGEWYRP